MRILAIETSCDETAAAVLEVKSSSFKLISNVVSSQVKIHAKFGGIVPEVAARKQMEMILPIISEALNFLPDKKIKNKLKDIDYLAVTQGPGLITSLTVGLETAKTLALVLDKPLILINHLEGHMLASLLKYENNFIIKNKIIYPALALVVSGGHTMLVLMKKENHYKIVGETLDDAVGEAYDKVAQILNLGYPGGPAIDRLAIQGLANKFNLPRPMIKSADLNFSFSGLKTAVLYLTQDLKNKNKLNEQITKDICLEFQTATIDVLLSKTITALKKFKPKTFLLGGGVAASQALRQKLNEKISKEFPQIKIFIPEIKFTGDNAAMVALAGYYKINKKSKIKNIKYKKIKAEPNMTLPHKS